MGAPSWLATFEALHRADTVDELWAVLLSWHGIRSSAAWEEPFGLFMRFHRHVPADAVLTAALLCTDHRWRKSGHRLVHRLAGAGVLSERDVDELAEMFLAETFDVEFVTAPRTGPAGRISGVGGRAGTVLSRPIWPPLRRWAAGRAVRTRPARWRELWAWADGLPSGDGAAVAAGVMDAAGDLAASEAREVVAAGLAAGSGVVRLAALPALAALEGEDAALAIAASDVSAKVRAWRPRVDRSQPESAAEATEHASTEDRDQQTLF